MLTTCREGPKAQATARTLHDLPLRAASMVHSTHAQKVKLPAGLGQLQQCMLTRHFGRLFAGPSVIATHAGGVGCCCQAIWAQRQGGCCDPAHGTSGCWVACTRAIIHILCLMGCSVAAPNQPCHIWRSTSFMLGHNCTKHT